MKRLGLLAILCLLTTSLYAQTGQLISGAGSNGPVAVVTADNSVAVSLSATNPTQIVAASTGLSIYVTGFGLTIGTTAATAQTVQFVYGTGTNCATGQTVMTGALSGATLVSSSGDNLPTYVTYGGGVGMVAKTPASQALCLKLTGTQPVGGIVSFAQFFWSEAYDYEAWPLPAFLRRQFKDHLGAVE